MKNIRSGWCTVLLALMATSLVIQAKTVALFFDSAYVQTAVSTGAEGYTMNLTLESLGLTVNTINGVTSNDFATALAGADVLIVPELEVGDLAAAMSADAIGVVSNFVAGGNSMILCGEAWGGNFDDILLTALFGYSAVSGYGIDYTGIPSAYTSDGAGTVFDGGPGALVGNSGLYPWLKTSLPPGTLSIYELTGGTNTYSSVALIPEGAGQVILLAWDWYNAAPLGSSDGGWIEVLWRAIATTGLEGDFYVDITSTNAVFPYNSWSNAATNIQHAVTIAGDGSTVHVNDGTYMLANEIVVGSDILIESENGPGATIVDGGGAVRGFNLGSSACILSGFTITNGFSIFDGGGVYCIGTTPIVSNCIVSGNTAALNGGGVYYGTSISCTISDNDASYGGGVCFGIASNCVISGNTAGDQGGGIYFGTVNNCTVSWNTAITNYGGGVRGGSANNCLVIGNSSGYDGAGFDSVAAVNCTVVSNIGGTPLDGGIYGGTTRNSIVTGNTPAEFDPDNGGFSEYTCSPALTHGVNGNITNAPDFMNPGAGDYRLSLGSPCADAGTNGYAIGATDLDGNPRIMNMVVDMGAYELVPPDHYVSAFGSHEYPFESWARAATNIQDAVDAALDGHTVHVTNDTYYLSSEVVVSSDILLQSVNGPDVTIIDGGGAVRGFNLGLSACTVSGFTVQNGYTAEYGGGIRCASTTPIVTNCTIIGCSSADNGGGMYSGTASHCMVISNTAAFACGGLYLTDSIDCLVKGNHANVNVGGIGDGTHVNSTIINNTAADTAGGVAYGTYDNCIIWYNSDTAGFNDVYPSGITLNSVCASDITHGVNGNITNAPSFMNLAGGNYRLKYGSPCINAGSNALVVGSVDLDWAARIVDTTVDMGAFEYDGSVYDSDGDTLTDDDELNMYCSDPLLVNTDGDAFDDAYEVANGFAPGIFTDFPDYLASNASGYGYFSSNDVLNLAVGDIGGMVTTNDMIDLWVQLWQSGDLITWTNAGPPVMWSEPVDSSVKLYRVGVDN